MVERSIRLWLNGQETIITTQPTRVLLDVLREDLKLISVKEGCGHGDCGTCMVMMDGEVVNSCLVLIGQAENAHIITLEGLSTGNNLHPLQHAFIEKWAFQCGFCTPGMIISAYALLLKNPEPSQEDIKDALVGNLCRCTDYHRVIEAVQQAAQDLRLQRIEADQDA
jgi:aerobic carbon-monoxide dehydrogenase small subunit